MRAMAVTWKWDAMTTRWQTGDVMSRVCVTGCSYNMARDIAWILEERKTARHFCDARRVAELY